jgi:peptide/nickel transport system permease protein
MLRYSIIRILWLIPILICVTFIVYALIDAAPGTIVDIMISEDMTQEQIDELYRSYDLDKPMVWRYGKYMNGLIHGDLGTSMVTGNKIWDEFFSRMWASVSLSFSGLIIGVIIAIPLGILAAKYAGTIWDNLITAFTLIGMSMPGFWLALMLLMWLTYKVKLFPTGYDGTWRCYVLPVISGGLTLSSGGCRQTRSAILETSRQDYLRTARAKGVPERRVTTHHKLRNAWIPIITQIGGLVAGSLAGNAVIEQVYTWPGTGRLLVQAITQRDGIMACGIVILTSTMFSIVLLLVDLAYALVDPRVKAAYQTKKKKKKGAIEE